MPIEHPAPTEATVKSLYAHAFSCGHGNCSKPLYRVDEQTGQRTLNSRICHIHARREGGPRWDLAQSAEQNRSADNLILMCVEHAAAIDDPVLVAAYTAELLRTWKAKQLERYDAIQQGWTLDNEMAQEAIRTSADTIVAAMNLHLGGSGGNAPGAGGGGGGAVGRNARAGRGGPGGGHRVDTGEFTLPPDGAARTEAEDILINKLSPGAGGGGAGAIGDDSIRWDGGGGGEHVSSHIDLVALRVAGFDHIEISVGAGGAPGRHGQDTVLNFVAKDGTILKTIRASGGRGGGTELPEGLVELSPDDVNSGFRISLLTLANAADLRDGLLFLLGASWDRYFAPHFPIDAVWIAVCTARWKRPLVECEPRGIFLSLADPSEHEVVRHVLTMAANQSGPGSLTWIQTINARLDREGVWSVRVYSGNFMLSEIDIHVLAAK